MAPPRAPLLEVFKGIVAAPERPYLLLKARSRGRGLIRCAPHCRLFAADTIASANVSLLLD